MKKQVMFLLILIISLFSINSYAVSLKVRVTNYPPHFMKDKSGNWYGLSIELCRVLLSEAGYTPIFEELPWARALKNLQYGTTDMMMNVGITDKRKSFLNFIGPQVDETVILVVPKNSNYKIESFDDFKKLPDRVGKELGTFYGEKLEEKIKSDPEFALKIDNTAKYTSLIKKLQKNHISAVVDDLYTASYRIKTDPGYKAFKIHPFIINQSWVYFAFSKKSVSPEMLSHLQAAYDSAKSKGDFQKVIDSYK